MWGRWRRGEGGEGFELVVIFMVGGVWWFLWSFLGCLYGFQCGSEISPNIM